MATFRLTLEQMQEQYNALSGMLKTHQVELAQKRATGPVAAQAARLVASALVEQINSPLDQVNSSIDLMGKLKHADTIATAAGSLLYESTAILLLVLRNLVSLVNDKITQANNITEREEWQTTLEKFHASYEGEQRNTVRCSGEADGGWSVGPNVYIGYRTILCPKCGRPVDLDRTGRIYPHNEPPLVQP